MSYYSLYLPAALHGLSAWVLAFSLACLVITGLYVAIAFLRGGEPVWALAGCGLVTALATFLTYCCLAFIGI